MLRTGMASAVAAPAHERAGNQCEWCHARNYQRIPSPDQKLFSRLLISIIRRATTVEDLVVLCQHYHLALDRDQHKQNAKETRLNKKDQARPLLAQAVRR